MNVRVKGGNTEGLSKWNNEKETKSYAQIHQKGTGTQTQRRSAVQTKEAVEEDKT